MKGKIMLEVTQIVSREVILPSGHANLLPRTEEVTFVVLEAGPTGSFTITLADPDLFGTFKVGSKVDLARALCTAENT